MIYPLLEKGDKISITKNSTFKLMGYEKVTGTVFLVYPDGHGIAFKCDQTKLMENFDFGSGDVRL
jgi:hypothetical protein